MQRSAFGNAWPDCGWFVGHSKVILARDSLAGELEFCWEITGSFE